MVVLRFNCTIKPDIIIFWKRLKREGKMRKNRIGWILISLIICGSAIYLTADSTRVAKLDKFSGTVIVQRDGKNLVPKADMPLYESDTILTRANSSALIILDDNSAIKVTSLSEVHLKELSGSIIRSKKTNVEIDNGKSWMRVKKLRSENARFKISTPNSTASVRGTHFATEVDKSQGSTYDVYEGEVQVSSLRDKNRVVAVKANCRANVNAKDDISTNKLTPAQLNQSRRNGFTFDEYGTKNYNVVVSLKPQVIPAGGEAALTVKFLENGMPYKGNVKFFFTLGGAAKFRDNGESEIEVESDSNGQTALTVTDTVAEKVAVRADVSFEGN
jgi:hypothetical protein